jgi:hypothetical protein
MKKATLADLRHLKVDLIREERPAEQAALESKIAQAEAAIGQPETTREMMGNSIPGAAVKVGGKYVENPVKRVVG